MTCDCGLKMRCIYSVPVSQRVRYRLYKCPYCGAWLETGEGEDGQLPDAIRRLLAKGKARRMAVIKNRRR